MLIVELTSTHIRVKGIKTFIKKQDGCNVIPLLDYYFFSTLSVRTLKLKPTITYYQVHYKIKCQSKSGYHNHQVFSIFWLIIFGKVWSVFSWDLNGDLYMTVESSGYQTVVLILSQPATSCSFETRQMVLYNFVGKAWDISSCQQWASRNKVEIK